MTSDIVIMDAVKLTMTVIGQLSTFIMIPLLISGLTIAVFQAATQINEASLSFIPKLVIIFFLILLMGDYLLDILVEFTRHILTQIPNLVM